MKHKPYIEDQHHDLPNITTKTVDEITNTACYSPYSWSSGQTEEPTIAHALLMNNLLSLYGIWGAFYFLYLAAHVTARDLGDGIPSTDTLVLDML